MLPPPHLHTSSAHQDLAAFLDNKRAELEAEKSAKLAELEAETSAKLAQFESDWKLETTTDEIISIEPKDPFAQYLDLLLGTERIILMSRIGSAYEVKICSGENLGVIQTRSHEVLAEQIEATVEQYGYESATEFVAQSKILSAKSARRVASKAKKKKTATSLPMASGAVVKSAEAEDGETKTAASGVESSSLRPPTGDRAGKKKTTTADTVCDECGTDYMKPEKLKNHKKTSPNGLCKLTVQPARSALNTYKTLNDAIVDPDVLKNLAAKKPVAVRVESGTVTSMSGNTTASLIISKCRNCKQSGGCATSCRMTVQIYKYQAKLEIDGLADTPVMVWDALNDVIFERNAGGDVVPLKPNEAHYNTNTDNFSQIHNISFTMRLKLSEYTNPRTNATSISIHIIQMTVC